MEFLEVVQEGNKRHTEEKKGEDGEERFERDKEETMCGTRMFLFLLVTRNMGVASAASEDFQKKDRWRMANGRREEREMVGFKMKMEKRSWNRRGLRTGVKCESRPM